MSSIYFANADYTDSKHFISINLEESGTVHISENEFSISIISEYPCILKLHDNKIGIDTIVYAKVQGNTVELSLNGYTSPAYILTRVSPGSPSRATRSRRCWAPVRHPPTA